MSSLVEEKIMAWDYCCVLFRGNSVALFGQKEVDFHAGNPSPLVDVSCSWEEPW